MNKKISKNKTYLKNATIFLILLTGFAIMSFIIPYSINKYLIKIYTPDSYLNYTNLDLWAKFPGYKLYKSIEHSFKPFDLSINQNQLQVKFIPDSEYKLKEKGNYENISFSDKTKKEVTYKKNLSFERISYNSLDKNFNTFNPLSLETITRITNINTIDKAYTVLNTTIKSMTNDKFFFDKIFAVYFFENLLSGSQANNKYLLDWLNTSLIDTPQQEKEKKIKKLLNQDSPHSWKKAIGFYRWLSLIDKDEITETWAKEEFGLSDNEVKKIVFKNSFIDSSRTFFESKLKIVFLKYENVSDCDNKTLSLYFLSEYPGIFKLFTNKVNDIKSFLTYYEFSSVNDTIIDFKTFYNDYYRKGEQTKPAFSEVVKIYLLKNLLIDTEEENLKSFYKYENLVYFFNTLAKNDLYSLYKRFGFTSYDQIEFMGQFLFFYFDIVNPKIYDAVVTDQENGVFVLFQNTLDYSYLILKNYTKYFALSKLINKSLENDNSLCKNIMEYIKIDPESIDNLCNPQNGKIKLNSYEDTKFWICSLYLCYDERAKNAYDSIFISALGEENFTTLKTQTADHPFFILISSSENKLKEAFGCVDICSIEQIAKIQFTTQGISKNIIFNEVTDSIFKWDNKLLSKSHENKWTTLDDNSNILKLISLKSKDENEYKSLSLNLLKDLVSFLRNKDAPLLFFKNKEEYNELKFFVFSYTINPQLTSLSMDKFLRGINLYNDDFINNQYNKFDGFIPNLSTTISFQELYNSDNKQKYKIRAGSLEFDADLIRKISKINDYTMINTPIQIQTSNNKIESLEIPLYYPVDNTSNKLTFTQLDPSKYIFDGVQVYPEQNELYFYDQLSARYLKFKYDSTKKLDNEYTCKNYLLDETNFTLDIKENRVFSNKSKEFGSIFNKFKKPYYISSVSSINKISNISNKAELESYTGASYICVEPYTFFVLDAKISIVYSVDFSSYKYFIDQLNFDKYNQDDLIPVFLYKYSFEIPENTIKPQYPYLKLLTKTSFICFLVSLILGGIFFILTIIFFCLYFKSIKKEDERTSHKLLDESSRESRADLDEYKLK